MEGTTSHGREKEGFDIVPVSCDDPVAKSAPAATDIEGPSQFEQAAAVLASSASHWTERRDAVTKLAQTQNPAAVGILGQLVRVDPERRVRESAVSALVRLRLPQAVGCLAQVAKRDPEPTLVRQAVAGIGELLRDIHDELVDDEVLRMIEKLSRLHRSKDVRVTAQEVLNEVDPKNRTTGAAE